MVLVTLRIRSALRLYCLALVLRACWRSRYRSRGQFRRLRLQYRAALLLPGWKMLRLPRQRRHIQSFVRKLEKLVN